MVMLAKTSSEMIWNHAYDFRPNYKAEVIVERIIVLLKQFFKKQIIVMIYVDPITEQDYNSMEPITQDIKIQKSFEIRLPSSCM